MAPSNVFPLNTMLTDSIEIAGGVVHNQPGNLANFRNIGDNDRLYFNIKYSF